MKLLSCNANRPLAEAIADYLDTRLTRSEVKTFSDQEIFVRIDENVRGEDVFVIQSTSYPANDNLMQLLICMDALKRASARRITAVILRQQASDCRFSRRWRRGSCSVPGKAA